MKINMIGLITIIVIIFLTYHMISEYSVDPVLYRKLCNNKYINVEFFKNKQMHLSIGNKFTNSENYRIPFVIYRTWKNKNLSEQFYKAWDKTNKYNPEFKQILYTDLDVNNFINSFDYPGLKKAYNCINPKYGAARADLFRYAILYKNGGFYMDIKSFAKGSIKEKLGDNDAFLLSKWPGRLYIGDREIFRSNNMTFASNIGEWEQYWLACEKEHPIMKAILDTCIRYILYPETNLLVNKSVKQLFGKRVVLCTTGPTMMTCAIDNYLMNNPSFDDYTITRPGFDDFIRYTEHKNTGWLDHHMAYKNAKSTHYSQVNEPLLLC
jgi:mannosyltransferase OCH1-like enzyme